MSNALTTVNRDEWAVMTEQAGLLVQTGFLPAAIKTKEQAVAVMLKGRELGIPPMHALSSIVVIQGKPTCSAELMAALVYRDHGDDALVFTEATNTRCTISYKRRSWAQRQSYSFTVEDARQAGLSGGNWQKYPAAMLRARAISAVARMAFPDTIGGMYTPEELGGAVAVTGDGEIVPIPETLPRDDDTPIRTATEVLVDTFTGPSDADLFIEELESVNDRRGLVPIKKRIRDAGLEEHDGVRSAYREAFDRLTGGDAVPADDRQPALVN